jgi:hypothetical protein
MISLTLAVQSPAQIDYPNLDDPFRQQFPNPVEMPDVTLLGSAVFAGDLYDVLYLNGYMWIADGLQYYSGNLKTFDVSDPENPSLVASHSLPRASAFRMEGDGNRLFISAKERGILIIDVSDPLNPFYLGKYPTRDTINDMDALGNLLCVMSENDGLLILDVSDPSAIQAISQTWTVGNRYSVAVNEDSLLTIAAGSAGLLFYSITDPAAPRYLNTISLSQKAFQDVVCQGELAHAVYRKTWMNDGGFAVVDLSNSPNFTILSQNGAFGVENFPECGLAVNGDTLFFAATQGGMGVWDVSDPEAPTRLGGYGGAFLPGHLIRWPTRVSYGGGYAYTIAPDRFPYPGRNEACVVDISDLTDPHPVGVFDPPDWVNKAVGSGDYAYVAASTDGLIIVDIRDPGAPFIAHSMEVFNIYFSASNLLYEENLVYATGGNQGLAIISVADPNDPQLLDGFLDYSSARRGIDKSGDLVAVSGSGVAPAPPGWMRIFDVSIPMSIEPLGFISFEIGANGVDMAGNLAYLALDTGLGIVDISNPYIPTLISETPTGDEANDVTVDGNIAFIADQSVGLVVMDVADPFHPALVSSLPTPGIPKDLELVGSTLYVADAVDMLVVDVSDILNPVITDIVKVNGTASGVSFDDGWIFLCDMYGFHILSH